jgi:SSS family solute:Na+ symporter
LGGFNSVVKTDIFQFIVLGILIIIIASVLKTGSQVPLTYMNPFKAGPVYITAFLLLGVLRLFAGQDYWQRVYAMRDEKVVKQSFLISGILLCLVAVILTYIGLVARTQFPSIDPDLAVLYSFTRLVPKALTNLVSIAFFAAVLSSADTVLFMLGMNLTNDFFQIQKNKRNYTRLAVAGIGIAAMLLALTFTSLVDLAILIKSIGLILPPIVLFIWWTEGDKNAITLSIALTSILVIGFAFGGFMRPELSFIAIFGSTLFYWGTVGVRKFLSRN